MEFILGGNRFDFDPEDVRRRMQGVEPDLVRTHVVRLNGRLYPCKQVLSILTGKPRADFNSHQAHQILKRMGLDVIVIPDEGDTP